MRIVILGANGQLGTPVLNRLLQDHPGAQVAGCVRAASRAAVAGDAAFLPHLLAFDPFRDDWSRLGRVDVLINCIGIIRETPALDFARAHMGLTALILQHRALIGNPKLIQISALGADVNSPSGFLRTKGLADAALLKHPHTVVLRPSIVCTPNTMLSRKLQLIGKLCRRTMGVLPFPEHLLPTKLQPVMVADVAALVSRLCGLHAHAGLIEIGGKDIFTLRQLLEGLPACRKIIPVPRVLWQRILPLFTRLFPSLLDREQQLMLQQDNVADTGECERVLGRPVAATAAFWQAALS
jgi:uncharacterized protein YbjT (DUF2867 family)